MKFLIDEDLPRSIVALLQSYGHEAYDVREIGLRGAKDSQIASYARGEMTFSRETTERIRRLVHGEGKTKKSLTIDVFAYETSMGL